MVHGELGELLERSVELGAIRAGVEAVAAGEGRAVVLEGPAGIGKTALVAAAYAQARDAGLRPLAARGSELELSAFTRRTHEDVSSRSWRCLFSAVHDDAVDDVDTQREDGERPPRVGAADRQ
jgi:hypothetical protein